jgi:hypothetical protein
MDIYITRAIVETLNASTTRLGPECDCLRVVQGRIDWPKFLVLSSTRRARCCSMVSPAALGSGVPDL